MSPNVFVPSSDLKAMVGLHQAEAAEHKRQNEKRLLVGLLRANAPIAPIAVSATPTTALMAWTWWMISSRNDLYASSLKSDGSAPTSGSYGRYRSTNKGTEAIVPSPCARGLALHGRREHNVA